MKTRRIYRKYSDPAFPLHVMKFEPRRVMSSFVHIHWHAEPELLYAQQGEFEIYDENENFLLHSGEVCIIPSGKTHAIRSLNPTGEYWSISFSMDLISMPDNHFFQQELVTPLRTGSLLLPNKITPQSGLSSNAIAALKDVIYGKREEQFLGILRFWLEILPLCKRNTQQQETNQNHSAVEACIRYMDANYASRITLDELAAHVHLHPNYLCSIFKGHSGQTVLEYLTALRIAKARYLLSKGNLSISQAAEQVGFNDTDHFSRTFKSLVGISPSAYRRAYRDN